jgi:hypothetical protein
VPLNPGFGFQNEESGEEVVVRACWTDDEWVCLNSYLSYAGDLLACNLIRSRSRVSLRLHYRHDQGLSIEVELPEWDHVAILLHRLRPFVLSREHTSLDRMLNLLGRRLESQELREALKAARAPSRCEIMQARIFTSSISDVVLNSRSAYPLGSTL